MKKRRIQGPDGKEVDATELTFQNVREHWNEYLVDDGSILKLKAVATEVFRIDGQYDPEGNPIYVLRSRNVLVVSPAENLKRRQEGGKE